MWGGGWVVDQFCFMGQNMFKQLKKLKLKLSLVAVLQTHVNTKHLKKKRMTQHDRRQKMQKEK